MLRLTEYIRDALAEKPYRPFDGVILIWNLTNTCNLHCRHCYSSAERKSEGDLTLDEVSKAVPGLKRAGVKFAILSGGEPLLREDIFDIAGELRSAGIMTYLSTNGLLIDRDNIGRIRDTFNYVGVSIDGAPGVHDRFRGMKGAYEKSLSAMRLLMDKGLKVGLRFTLSPQTRQSLAHVFELAEREGIPKIYISHLVYSGRGGGLTDLEKKDYRDSVGFVLSKAFEYAATGGPDLVTGNNEADAVALLDEFTRRYPEKRDLLRERLKCWGGNQAGARLANITSLGEVKPDPFFFHSVGSVRERCFDEVWGGNGILTRLRERPRRLDGRCGQCPHIEICNGNSRARAYSAYGGYFEEDPACYVQQ